LEAPFWRALRMIAKERKNTIGAVIAEIDSARGPNRNLSSAIRTFVLACYMSPDQRGAMLRGSEIMPQDERQQAARNPTNRP
jgi:predicted DNA-binding ribbon-helix-helix protein